MKRSRKTKPIPPVPVVDKADGDVLQMIRPQGKKPPPANGIVITEGRVGIHAVQMATPVSKPAAMQIVWRPGRPPNSMFIPEYQIKFVELQRKHAQKLADMSGRTIKFKALV